MCGSLIVPIQLLDLLARNAEETHPECVTKCIGASVRDILRQMRGIPAKLRDKEELYPAQD
jgi:hypothetical protein